MAVHQTGPGATAAARPADEAGAVHRQPDSLPEVQARPRGAAAATLIYLAVTAAAWAYMYFTLLHAASARP
ncbi:MAG TPA: hypothetical protein VIK90_03090 [Limnochordales bacterium]